MNRIESHIGEKTISVIAGVTAPVVYDLAVKSEPLLLDSLPATNGFLFLATAMLAYAILRATSSKPPRINP